MSARYDAADIEVLTGLQPVRKRPGMYTDTARPNHLVQEVVDNSVDEALAGHCSRIDVILHADGAVTVSDDGRGMPVDVHPGEQISGVEVILTKLHAGGKFSNRNYKFSGGLHGVGVSVVNALSTELQVRVKRGGVEYAMTFNGGDPVTPLEEVGKVGRNNTGTSIRFMPDSVFFDSTRILVPRLKHLLRAKAVLCPGLTVALVDEAAGEREVWHYEDGLRGYLTAAMPDADLVPTDAIQGNAESEQAAVTWALQWRADDGELVTESYVNLVPTAQGGTHVNGLRQGLLEALREFCEFRNLLPRGIKITADDAAERAAYVLSLKMTEPQFSGQTKERLSSQGASGIVASAVRDTLALWLNQHVEAGERIAQLAIDRALIRQRAAKAVVRKKLAGAGPALPGKLTDCTSNDLNESELFLVEGDSAGGSAKQARDKDFQAILPLRGKIMNTWEVESTQVLASQEVHDIAVAIGVDPASSNLEGLRYGKICILADADSDGAHIATLLCALFVRHFRPVVEAGHVYVAMPPLYRIDAGKEVLYALDDTERDALIKRLEADRIRGKISIQRFKGLGEMNPSQLRETAMLPSSRRLVQLTIDDNLATDSLMDLLLAKKRSGERRDWLERKGNLAAVD